jgi:SAM-dependent MidA family methyltransferase
MISFAEWMKRCLYDPETGYYAAGRVAFGRGDGADFWTWPGRLRPLFGFMLAEFARTVDTVLGPSDLPFTLLELGAGDGALAADVIARFHDTGFPAGFRYVIGEPSAGLRARQERRLFAFISEGRAEVRDLDAVDLRWDGPFRGLIFANEVLTALPAELLRFHGAGEVRQIHVADDGVPREVEVPLTEGRTESPSAEIRRYVETLRPLVRDLEALHLEPADLLVGVAIPEFAAGLGRLLTAPGGEGVALIVDYGGTSRHILDPRSLGPHLRVYGEGTTPYEAPGRTDITYDLDFTRLARCALAAGLTPLFFGHQGVLERPPIDLMSDAFLDLLLADRIAEGAESDEDARAAAGTLVSGFCTAPGFRSLLLGADPAMADASDLPPTDPLFGPGLGTLDPTCPIVDLRAALSDAGLPPEAAGILKPGGDPIADLTDHRLHADGRAVLELLLKRGWLLLP